MIVRKCVCRERSISLCDGAAQITAKSPKKEEKKKLYFYKPQLLDLLFSDTAIS